jgi:hypothetical protein
MMDGTAQGPEDVKKSARAADDSLISSGEFRTSRLKWLISPPSLLAAKS